MLIVIRCYCFWMVGSQGAKSLLIIYEIAFKTPLENLLHGNNVLATPDQVKPAGVKQTQTRADLGPAPAIRARLWLVHTCARAETQPHRGEARLSRLSCGHDPARYSTLRQRLVQDLRESGWWARECITAARRVPSSFLLLVAAVFSR